MHQKGKVDFVKKKKGWIQERRRTLAAGNDKHYQDIVIQMTQDEELAVNIRLSEVLAKVGLTQ